MCVLCLEVLKGAWDLCKGKAQRKKERRKKSQEVKKIKPFYTREKKGLGPGLASHILRKRQSGKEGRKKSAPNFLFGFYMGDMENVNLTWSLGYCSHPWVEPFLGEKEEMAPCTALAYPS